MALDKKPSIYPKNGSIGSPEELDAYGVWIKSEPQDLASGFADAVDFGGGAMSFETDFNTGFGAEFEDIGDSDIGMEIPENEIDDFNVAGFDEGMTVEVETAGKTWQDSDRMSTDSPHEHGARSEMSTHLLMRIANELSSIRSELTTLKKDFAGIRTDGVSGGEPHVDDAALRSAADSGGLFAEKDENKTALTGDEIENIITSADFTGEEDFAFDSLREEDAATLKKLSEENEAALAELKVAGAEEAQTKEPVFETTAEAAQEQDLFEDTVILDPLDEIGELRSLRLEGADPMTSAPDDTQYLEEDPFAIETPEELTPGENFPDIQPLDLNLDDASLSLSLDDFDDASSLELGDEFGSEDGFTSLDLSDAVIEEPDLSAEIAEPPLEEPALADLSLEIPDFDTGADSELEVIPEGFEKKAEEDTVLLDDDPEEALVVEDLAAVDINVDIPGSVITASGVPAGDDINIPESMHRRLKDVLSYMDHLLESLPEDKIKEFAQSKHFDTYKRIFKDLGLV